MMTLGSVLMAVAMGAWVAGRGCGRASPMVIAGLLLSGLASGPGRAGRTRPSIAAAVDPGDLGIANGMSTTMMNIGVIAGIQTMFTVLGDGRTPQDFARVFAVGAVVAGVGLIGARMVTSTVRVPAGRIVVARAELA